MSSLSSSRFLLLTLWNSLLLTICCARTSPANRIGSIRSSNTWCQSIQICIKWLVTSPCASLIPAGHTTLCSPESRWTKTSTIAKRILRSKTSPTQSDHSFLDLLKTKVVDSKVFFTPCVFSLITPTTKSNLAIWKAWWHISRLAQSLLSMCSVWGPIMIF